MYPPTPPTTEMRIAVLQTPSSWLTALLVIFVLLGAPSPAPSSAQDLPQWAEPTAPPAPGARTQAPAPPIFTPGSGSPGAGPSHRRERGRAAPERDRSRGFPDRDARGTYGTTQAQGCGNCGPNEKCCENPGGNLLCKPMNAGCGGGTEVPLSPLGTFLLALFGGGYGAYRMRHAEQGFVSQ